ncbi:MAG: acetate--CoA ligase family protein [Thermodesulfobacteriota bacterium]
MVIDEIERLVKEALSLERETLVEPDAKEVLRLAGITVPAFKVVKDVNVAMVEGAKMRAPLVLKLISPNIAHKSDVGGVKTGIKGPEEIENAWSEMILRVSDEAPMAMIEGFILEEEAPQGVELILGAIKDPQFGVTVMFGTGGVAVELMKDVSFALAPLDEEAALKMMSEVKGFSLLTGYRGSPACDARAAANVLVKLAKVVESTNGLKSLEINPLIVYEKGVMAVDARAELDVMDGYKASAPANP